VSDTNGTTVDPAEVDRLRRLLARANQELANVRASIGPKRLWPGRPLPEAIREMILELEGRS
jgi:hypothetical protein